MGVSSSGKTTLGKALADATNGIFLDGDDYHPTSNKTKMASGQPLSDEDRQPWLNIIGQLAAKHSESSSPVFIACSALKQSYRETILSHCQSISFLFLTAPAETLRSRIETRHFGGSHFMPPSLLDSQLNTLEVPADCLHIDSSKPIPDLVQFVLSQIMLGST